MTHSISVGVFDWVNFPGQPGFYPDDIPEEWKLSFYSNEFNSACLSLAGLDSQPERLTEWVEDLPETFELSIYMDHSTQIPILQSLLQQVDGQLYALILGPREGNNLLHNKNLQALLSTSGLADVALYEFNQIWRPDHRVRADHRIAMFPVAENMRQNRAWIDQWLKDSESDPDASQKTLWLAGSEISYQRLSEMRTLIELMGY